MFDDILIIVQLNCDTFVWIIQLKDKFWGNHSTRLKLILTFNSGRGNCTGKNYRFIGTLYIYNNII